MLSEEVRLRLQDRFKAKSAIKHKHKFSYTNVYYVDQHTPVTITCPIHGDIQVKPSAHIRGYDCKQCGVTRSASSHRLTLQDFLMKAQIVHGDTYLYNKATYTNHSTPVIITCRKHGDFLQRPNSHLQGSGCKSCYLDRHASASTKHLQKGVVIKPQHTIQDSQRKTRKRILLENTLAVNQFTATSSVEDIHNTLKGDKACIIINTLLSALQHLNHIHLPYIEQALQVDSKIGTKALVQLSHYITLHNHLPKCKRCTKEFISKDSNWNLITEYCSTTCAKSKDILKGHADRFSFAQFPTQSFLQGMIDYYEQVKVHKGTPLRYFVTQARLHNIYTQDSFEEAFIGYFSYLNTSVFISLCKELLARNDYIRCVHCSSYYPVRQNEGGNGLVLEGYCSSACRYVSSVKKDKSRQTCLTRYGFKSNLIPYAIANGKIKKEKHFHVIKEAFVKKNIRVTSSVEDYKGTTHGGVEVTCDNCNTSWKQSFVQASSYFVCRTCEPATKSHQESIVIQWLRELLPPSTEIKHGDRVVIHPKELDIYVPAHRLAIEINGVFWHSTNLPEEVAYYKHRHLNKTKACAEKGIHLIHITDQEVLCKPELIKSILANQLGLSSNKVAGRKCLIEEVPPQELKDFLNVNHLQGFTRSSINLGLYYAGELLQVMTFGKSRFNTNYSYELIRLCTKINASITGGAERLFNHFTKNYLQHGETIISYCDRRLFKGLVYKKLGFSHINNTTPNYVYLDKASTYVGSRHTFQKHKLPAILSHFDINKTEVDNMLMNNYRIMFDCGNSVWKYSKT